MIFLYIFVSDIIKISFLFIFLVPRSKFFKLRIFNFKNYIQLQFLPKIKKIEKMSDNYNHVWCDFLQNLFLGLCVRMQRRRKKKILRLRIKNVSFKLLILLCKYYSYSVKQLIAKICPFLSKFEILSYDCLISLNFCKFAKDPSLPCVK